MVVKLDTESGGDMDYVVEMREVMVRTVNDRCTLVIDMTINNHCVEAVIDSGAQVPVLIRRLYDSLSCRPRPVESIRLKVASASGVMVGCRVDGVEVDLGDSHGNYNMTKLLANINMAGAVRRMGPEKCVSYGETWHIARNCRSDVQRPYHRPRDGVYIKAAQVKKTWFIYPLCICQQLNPNSNH